MSSRARAPLPAQTRGSRSEGQPLAPELRAGLEPQFNHDFGQVRVYADGQADHLARSFEARAFTVGQDVFFRAGAYQPHSPEGLGLLAHELTHTIQQRGAPRDQRLPLSDSQPAAELEARQASGAVLSGQLARVSPVGERSIARQPESEPASEASKAAVVAGNLSWMNAFNPNWAWNLSQQGLTGTSTDGITTRTQRADASLKDGFGFNLGQRRVIEADKDHALESEHELSFKDGMLGWAWGSGGRSLAEDGSKIADSRREKINLSQTGFGLESASSSTRDTVTQSRSSAVEFKDGAWNASIERGRSFALDDDHQMSSTNKFSLGSTGASATWGNQSRIKDVELGTVESQQKSTALGWGPNGFNFARSNSQSSEIGNQTFTNGSSWGYSNGNLSYAKQNAVTTKDDSGKEVSESNSKGVQFGRDGLGFHAAKTDAQGNKTAVNMNGNAGLDASGNLNNLQMGAGFSRNNTSVSAHGGYTVEASEPRQQGTTWVVDWSRTLNAGGKVGASKGPANLSAGANYSDREFGARNFKSKAEAEAFQKDAAARLPSHAHDPNTAEGAMYLGIGESQGRGHSLDGSLSGGVSLSGGGNIGAGLERGSSNSLSVRRVSANIFEVTDESGARKGKNFSMGTLAGGATGHSASDQSSSRTLRFDLATSEGRAAFNAFNQNPGVIPATGANLVSSTQTTGEESGTTVKLPWHSNDRTSRTEEALTQDEQGKLERYTGKATEQISTNLPFFSKTHDNVGVRFDALERNDTYNHYALSGSVDSSGGADSLRHLAALTSSAYRTSEGAKPSGKWGVEVEITDKMVNQFVKEIGSERVRDMSIFEGSDPRNELREHLQDAKTSDDKKRALAKFFADDGFDGKAIKQMREVLTGGYVNPWSFGSDYESLKGNKLGNFNYDLTLPGDRNFQGMGARLELEGKIKQFQQLISVNPAAAGTLHGQIAPLLDEVRRQRNEIADPKRYTDLPDELRERQVARLEGYIESLSSLRTQSGEAMIEADAPKPVETTKKGGKAGIAETGPLKELGADIAEWSGNIKQDQSDYQFYKSEYGTLRRQQARLGIHLDGIAPLEQEALRFAEQAQKLGPRIDDLRAEYLQLRADPNQATRALEVGGKLKALLQDQSDLWQDASNGMDNARTRLDTMLEDAQSESSQPAVPTPMALEPPKRNKKSTRH